MGKHAKFNSIDKGLLFECQDMAGAVRDRRAPGDLARASFGASTTMCVREIVQRLAIQGILRYAAPAPAPAAASRRDR